MEFTNEIFFNKPLKAENSVIITYSGKLYREHSKDVSIVYGYGDNWDYTDSSPMVETDNGFEVTITLKNYNTFNFCFTNSYNIWDNNSGFNYISPISPKDEEQEGKTNEEQSIDTNDVNNEFFEEVSENNEEIEKAFSALLDSLLNDADIDTDAVDVSDLSGFGLQSVENINENDMVNCDEIFSEMFNELTNENPKNEVIENVAQVEFANDNEQELDKLMDNLLDSISDSNNEQDEEVVAPIERIEPEKYEDLTDTENCNLPAVANSQKEDILDKIINISYDLTKKVTNACKKLGNLIKLKAQELGLFNKEN